MTQQDVVSSAAGALIQSEVFETYICYDEKGIPTLVNGYALITGAGKIGSRWFRAR